MENFDLSKEDRIWYYTEAKYLMAGGTTTTEREFTKWVMELGKACGWLIYHVPDSRRAPAGFPDLVLLRPPESLFYELKRTGKQGTLKPLQKQWIDGLAECGLEAGVWKPSEIPEIWTRLTGLRFEP